MKYFKCAFLAVAFWLATIGIAAAAPSVILDGQQITFDVPPVVDQGRTLVPLRAIFQPLGADVQWDGASQMVTASRGSTTIKLTIHGLAYKNGQQVNIDVPAQIVDGRTMVPLRFVSEAISAGVFWDGATQTINISSPEKTERMSVIDVGQGDSILLQLPPFPDPDGVGASCFCLDSQHGHQPFALAWV